MLKNIFKSTMESKMSQGGASGSPQYETNQSIKRKLEAEMLSMQKRMTRGANRWAADMYIPSHPGTSDRPSLYDWLAQGVDRVEDIDDPKVRVFLKEMKQKFKSYWNLMKFLSKEPNQILILKTRKSLRSRLTRPRVQDRDHRPLRHARQVQEGDQGPDARPTGAQGELTRRA